VVGHRDANWAHSNSAVTDFLLLSAVWVVGAVFADRNAPALGGIFNQQGLGSLTRIFYSDVYGPSIKQSKMHISTCGILQFGQSGHPIWQHKDMCRVMQNSELFPLQ
jgi:hypothetical protein